MIFLKGFLMAVWLYCAYISFLNNAWEIVRKKAMENKKSRDQQIVLELVGVLAFVIWFYLK